VLYKAVRSTKIRLIVVGIFFIIWFVVKSIWLIDPTPFLQARQMLCFPLGILLASLPQFKNWCEKTKTIVWIVLAVVCFAIYILLHTSFLSVENTPVILYNLIALPTCSGFAFAVIGITYKIRFLQNNLMALLSVIAYEFYIIHGYFIDGIHIGNQWINVLLFVVYSFASAVALHFVIVGILKALKIIQNKIRKIKTVKQEELTQDDRPYSDNIDS